MSYCGPNSAWALLTGPEVAWHGVASALLLKEVIFPREGETSTLRQPAQVNLELQP